MKHLKQILLFDADDTLWENNVYFERAIAAYVSYLDHRVHTRNEVREHLNRVERATIAAHGYGLKSFQRSLITCFEQLISAPLTSAQHERIVSFTNSIAEQEIELLPGVLQTLAELTRKHVLILVTKGDPSEQIDKLSRSGLNHYFPQVEVLTEKHETAYRSMIDRNGWQAERTWMIGNSPKSDVNPALAAGLNAIFIPHDFTWVLEHEVVNQPPQGQQFLELSSFGEMLTHF